MEKKQGQDNEKKKCNSNEWEEQIKKNQRKMETEKININIHK